MTRHSLREWWPAARLHLIICWSKCDPTGNQSYHLPAYGLLSESFVFEFRFAGVNVDSHPRAVRLHVLAETCDVTLSWPPPCCRLIGAEQSGVQTCAHGRQNTHSVRPSYLPPFGSTSQPLVELAATAKAWDHLSAPPPPHFSHSQQHCDSLSGLLREKPHSGLWIMLHNALLCFPGAAKGAGRVDPTRFVFDSFASLDHVMGWATAVGFKWRDCVAFLKKNCRICWNVVRLRLNLKVWVWSGYKERAKWSIIKVVIRVFTVRFWLWTFICGVSPVSVEFAWFFPGSPGSVHSTNICKK